MASFFLDTATSNRYFTGVRQVVIGANLYVRPTAQTYLDLGFTEVTIDPRPNDKFYVVSDVNDDGTYNFTPRDLATVKESLVGEQTQNTKVALQNSDTVVVEALEAAAPVPADWASFRTNARDARDANIVAINGAADIGALEALYTAPQYVLVDPLDPSLGLQLNPAAYLSPIPLNPDQLGIISGQITFHRSGGNLIDGVFDSIDGVFEYDLTLRLVTSDTLLTYALPEGFKATAGELQTGSQDVQLEYQGTVLATFTLVTGTQDQVFTF